MTKGPMKIFRLSAILTALLLLLGFTSCEHKELCFDHSHIVRVKVEYDWRDAPEANPYGMCVFFYPLDPGQEPRRFDFAGLEGGYVDIEAGRYILITYNNDTDGVYFRNMQVYTDLEAFTRNGGLLESLGHRSAAPPRASGTQDERVVICPDMMWGCQAVDVTVDETGVTYTHKHWEAGESRVPDDPMVSEQVITLFPHELTCIYTYEIRNVKNIQNISRMTASLSGMAGSLNLFTEELGREPVTLPVDAWKDGDSTIRGRFITFGHHEENPMPHKMMLYVWTNDGKAYVYGTENEKFDVTDQVHSAPDRRRVHLIIDGIDIPEPLPDPDDPGAFTPGVDDWGEENLVVPM